MLVKIEVDSIVVLYFILVSIEEGALLGVRPQYDEILKVSLIVDEVAPVDTGCGLDSALLEVGIRIERLRDHHGLGQEN